MKPLVCWSLISYSNLFYMDSRNYTYLYVGIRNLLKMRHSRNSINQNGIGDIGLLWSCRRFAPRYSSPEGWTANDNCRYARNSIVLLRYACECRRRLLGSRFDCMPLMRQSHAGITLRYTIYVRLQLAHCVRPAPPILNPSTRRVSLFIGQNIRVNRKIYAQPIQMMACVVGQSPRVYIMLSQYR